VLWPGSTEVDQSATFEKRWKAQTRKISPSSLFSPRVFVFVSNVLLDGVLKPGDGVLLRLRFAKGVRGVPE